MTANNITADGVEAGNGGNINANGTITGGTINGEQGTIGGVGMADGTITADKGTIGGVTLENGKVNGADITENSFNGVGMETATSPLMVKLMQVLQISVALKSATTK